MYSNVNLQVWESKVTHKIAITIKIIFKNTMYMYTNEPKDHTKHEFLLI